MHIFHSYSKVFGAVLLISGCCIGAGMLGLPLVSLEAGYIPTLLMFGFSWAFMASTGLLVLEINLRCGEGSNLMSMAETVLGKGAKYLVAILFAFLFYCLILAYISGTGALLEEIFSLPKWMGSLSICLLFGFIIYLGTRQVDTINRLFIFGLAVGYLSLIFLGISSVTIDNLKHIGWSYAVPVLPAMIISFGYHNLIPSLNTYLKGNVAGLRTAILIGSLIPLIVYLMWEFVFLGTVAHNSESVDAIKNGSMVTELFRTGSGSSLSVYAMQIFSFFAIITSLLTVAMSFVDFLIDGLRLKATQSHRALSCILVLLPPLFFSFFCANIFLTALNYAGAFGAVILFGILPVIMVWKGRYIDAVSRNEQLPGGKATLFFLAIFALFIFTMQLKIELGV
ncbi:Tyrosine-specific transport protein 1 [Chlamydiales bacterium STE3]|nr:Tyrosine-specific transport protein 1 [Chlamydiales bacterium STE3]